MVTLIMMTPEQLREWRDRNGYTQLRLAKALGVFRESIVRWETGVRKIPSFLHLALRCLELEGGDKKAKGHKKEEKPLAKKELSDAYVTRLLLKDSFIKRLGVTREYISPEIIELKRQQLIASRKLREELKGRSTTKKGGKRHG
jgi:transcriptional regulator with XRE-family HTH domain